MAPDGAAHGASGIQTQSVPEHRVDRHGGFHLRKQRRGQQPAAEQRAVEPGQVRGGGDHRAGGPRPGRADQRGDVQRLAGGQERVAGQQVAVRVIPADATVGDRERRAVQPERGEDPATQLALRGMTGRGLDDQPDQDVVGVGIRPAGAGRKQRWVRGRDRDQALRGPGFRGIGQQITQKAGVVGVVEDPAGVVEQLPYRNRGAVRDPTGQPPLDRVVQPQGALTDQLQHHGGDHRLGDAAHPEPGRAAQRNRRVQPGLPAGPGPCRSGAVVDQRQHARCAVGDQLVQQRLQPRTVRVSGGRRRRRRRCHTQAHHQQHRRGQCHQPAPPQPNRRRAPAKPHHDAPKGIRPGPVEHRAIPPPLQQLITATPPRREIRPRTERTGRVFHRRPAPRQRKTRISWR